MDPESGKRASRQFVRFRESGDPAALTAVFDLTAPELLAVAQHLVREPAIAEDLVQETFLIAIEKARRFDPAKPIVPWLVGILLRETRKHRRRARRAIDADRLREPDSPDGEQVALGGELQTVVDEALASLPRRYADVLRMHLQDGERPRDIAARTGAAPGTVRVQLHRGLELLRKALPSGIGLGALGITETRGLAAVRAVVEHEAVVKGPMLAAAGASSGAALTLPTLPLIGAIAMGTKTLLATGILAAAGITALVARGEDAPTAAVREHVAETVERDVESSLARVDAIEAEPRERSSVAPPKDAHVTTTPAATPTVEPVAREGGVVLQGEVSGVEEVPASGFELVVTIATASPRTATIPIAGNGPYRLALDEYLEPDDDPRQLRISVITRAEGYLPSGGWAKAVSKKRARDVTLVADVVAQPIVRVLRGTTVGEDGEPLGDAWAVFVPVDVTPPLEQEHMADTWIGRDGAFELPLADARAGTLMISRSGHAYAHVPISEEELGDVDLGDVELGPGASIEGRALLDGAPLDPGSVVIASIEYRSSPWILATRNGVLVRSGRGAHRRVEARVEDGGTFELRGLEAGVEYSLVAVPASRTRGASGTLLSAGTSGTPVTAPANGVELDWGLTLVHVSVRGNGRPIDDARVHRPRPDDGPLALVPAGVNGGIEGRARSNRSGIVDVLVERGTVTTLEVDAPGYEPRRVDLDPTMLGADRTLVVDLDAGDAPPELELVFDYDGPGTLDGAIVYLVVYGASSGTERLGPAPVRDGRATLGPVPDGVNIGRVALHVPQSVALADLPMDRISNRVLQLANLEGGRTHTLEVEVGVGGRVELHLVGRDPELDPPSFELVEATGNVVRPQLFRDDPRGHDSSRIIDTDGPWYLGRSLPPGRYVLRQVGAAYAQDEREVEVGAGEVEVVSFQLEPR